MQKASTNNGKLHEELRNKHDLMLKTAKKDCTEIFLLLTPLDLS